MPEHVGMSNRFVQRIAEGAQRSRIVDPILAARPPIVVVSAPSGYGKTVLAAQVAGSGRFADVIWMRGADTATGSSDILNRLLECLRADGQSIGGLQVDELVHACSAELAALPDDRSLLLVVDDLSCGHDVVSLDSVSRAWAEAPSGSVALVTTRGRMQISDPDGHWLVSSHELLLDDEEIRQVCHRLVGSVPVAEDVARLAERSGRHAALLTLIARHAALSGASGASAQASAPAASLVRTLTDTQLTDIERRVLDCAAIIGDGRVSVLERACERDGGSGGPGQDCIGAASGRCGERRRANHVLSA